MLFDKFCGLVERGVLPGKLGEEARFLAREAKLFFLDKDPRGFLTTDIDSIREVEDSFFLPFACIAVEDQVSCIFIRNEDGNARGLKAKRRSLEVRQLLGVEIEAVASKLAVHKSELRDALTITPGYTHEMSVVDDSIQHLFSTPGVLVASKRHREPLEFLAEADNEGIATDAARNVRAAIEEIILINSPEFFIVERTSTTTRKAASGRIMRSDQRPTYRILHRARAREELGLREEGGRELNPHPRRAHMRTLRDERYAASGKQGKEIFVRSTWVGPGESVVGRYRYKVLVDR